MGPRDRRAESRSPAAVHRVRLLRAVRALGRLAPHPQLQPLSLRGVALCLPEHGDAPGPRVERTARRPRARLPGAVRAALPLFPADPDGAPGAGLDLLSEGRLAALALVLDLDLSGYTRTRPMALIGDDVAAQLKDEFGQLKDPVELAVFSQ